MDEQQRIKVGERIAEVRKSKGLTQSQLSEEIDVDKNTISNMERGIYKLDLEKIVLIAKVLDVSLDYLLFKKETPSIETVFKRYIKLPREERDKSERLLLAIMQECHPNLSI